MTKVKHNIENKCIQFEANAPNGWKNDRIPSGIRLLIFWEMILRSVLCSNSAILDELLPTAFRFGLLLAVSVVWLVPSGASAGDRSQTGAYFSAAGVFGIPTELKDEIELSFNPVVGGGNAGLGVQVKPGWGVNGRVGYRFHPRFAVQLQGEWISTFEIATSKGRREEPRGKQQIEDIETWVATADARFFLLTGRVQPNLALGIGAMGIDVKNRSSAGRGGTPSVTSDRSDGTDLAARMGAGVDFVLNRNFFVGLDVSYVIPTGEIQDFDYVSIVFGFGLRY
ncbi:MAG TPA: porin family protein [Deltaproteobacteria bacterium]|nr:porin family protein [Deltaproteobacteria bacterium]